MSVRRSVPSYLRTTNMAVFEDKKSLHVIINNDAMSDDEVVAFEVLPRARRFVSLKSLPLKNEPLLSFKYLLGAPSS